MRVTNSATEHQLLEGKYKNSRNNLLLVVIFTAVNILLLVLKSNTYFLFSAFIPYIFVHLGMLLCGMSPAEYYGDTTGIEFLSPVVFAVLLVAALLILALYLLCWIFSKKPKLGWMITALVLFSVDTIGMFLFMDMQASAILDIAFHIWVLVSLCLGIRACVKLKKIPVDVIEVEATQEEPTENSED